RPSSGWGRTGIGDVNVWVMSVLPRWVLGDDTGAAPHRWCGAAPVATLTRRSGGRGPQGPPRDGSVTDAEAEEPGDGAAGLLDDLADGLLVVLGERLVQEAVLLEVAVQATLDDLRDGLLGLALVLGGVLGDAALLGDDLLGDLVAREVG